MQHPPCRLRHALVLCMTALISVHGFYPGNILVLRVTNSANGALTGSAAAVWIDEIALNGSLAQAPVGLPTTGPSSCTLAGNTTAEGKLSISPNGGHVGIACYLAPEGTPAVTSSTRSRAVVILNATAALSQPQSTGTAFTSPPRRVYGAIM
jgi:hypothetical protein